MPDLNLRAARHVAVVNLFVELVDEAAGLREADMFPSDRLLLDTIDLAAAELLCSLDAARDEMGVLAPAVLDR